MTNDDLCLLQLRLVEMEATMLDCFASLDALLRNENGISDQSALHQSSGSSTRTGETIIARFAEMQLHFTNELAGMRRHLGEIELRMELEQVEVEECEESELSSAGTPFPTTPSVEKTIIWAPPLTPKAVRSPVTPTPSRATLTPLTNQFLAVPTPTKARMHQAISLPRLTVDLPPNMPASAAILALISSAGPKGCFRAQIYQYLETYSDTWARKTRSQLTHDAANEIIRLKAKGKVREDIGKVLFAAD